MTDYTVRPGDTFNSIARLFDIPLANLIFANPNIPDPDYIVAGQIIHLPPGYPVRRVISVNGFAFPEIDSQVLQDTLYYLTYLSIYSYQVRSDGSLIRIDDTAMIRQARQVRVAPLMVITNIDGSGGFSSDLAHTILTDELLGKTLINNVVNVLKSRNYYGLNINFENVYRADREAFTRFFQMFTITLHPLGYIVVATDAIETGPNQSMLVYDMLNFAAYARLANQIFIIVAYAFGNAYGPPTAVTPIDQVRLALDYAVSVIPSQSILLGMTNYGFDWTLPYHVGTTAQMLTPAQARDLAARTGSIVQFNEETQSPYFNYEDNMGLRHVVWFDNEQSIRTRLELVRIYNLGGISFWTINIFSPESYQTLNSMYEIRKVL